MKATAKLHEAPLFAGAASTVRLSDYMAIIKPRICFLVLLTTTAGYYLGHLGGKFSWSLLGWTLLGTALVAAAGSTLNQLYERIPDARMRRTQDRPLASGRMTPAYAKGLSAVLSVSGLLVLFLGASLAVTAIAALTLILYSLVYTPLKQNTPLALWVGAIPGALPPMIGWVAAHEGMGGIGWSLFAVLFIWQIPHFLAIAWIYRDEYSKAGYKTLPAVEESGWHSGLQATLWAALLLPASWSVAAFGLAGDWYLLGACLLGLAYLAASLRFWQVRTEETAKTLFKVSLIYLPFLLILMILDSRILL